MKKHYILALMASVVCGMSVQAQESVQPVQSQKGRSQIERSEIPPLVQKTGSLLRSGATNLADSLIRADGNGVNMYKFVFEYTKMDKNRVFLVTSGMLPPRVGQVKSLTLTPIRMMRMGIKSV